MEPSIYLAFIKSLESQGPWYVVAFGVLLILATMMIKLVPYWAGYQQKRLELEDREIKRREDADRKGQEIQGQMILQNQRSNTVMESLDKQMAFLNLQLTESKERSRDMAIEVHDIHRKVVKGE
jgi:Tfp pilus assembly protein PilO